MLIYSGKPIIKGKDAIKEMVEAGYKIPGFKISRKPQSVEVSRRGDKAYMIDQNQIAVKDSTGRQLTEFNKSVTVWRKKRGVMEKCGRYFNARPDT